MQSSELGESSVDASRATRGAPRIERELCRESLLRLAAREASLIHVAGFYATEPEFRASVIRQLLEHPRLGNYKRKYTASVGRVGTPHIDAEGSEEAAVKYHNDAIASINEIRALFAPRPTPIDQVRLSLQEFWPGGANLQRLHGRSCFVGAIRVFQPSVSEFYPHHDRIEEESDAPEIRGVVEQLVANVYLDTAPDGGDLQLWLREADESERRRISSDEGLSRDDIEPPRLVIHPEPGDLTIFCSRMLHAVTPSQSKHRVGMAAFIACRGPNEPLGYWS